MLNKWDLAPDDVAEPREIERLTRERLRGADHAPVLAVSALTGRKVGRIFDVVGRVEANFARKIPTGELNRLFEEITARRRLHKLLL